MSNDVLTAREDMTIEEVLKLLINSRITGMPVVDKDGKMVGVVSEYDILEQLSTATDFKPDAFRKKIQFSKSADSITASTPLSEIIDRFVKAKYRRLPVIDESGKLIGIITRRDLMRVFYYRAALV